MRYCFGKAVKMFSALQGRSQPNTAGGEGEKISDGAKYLS